MKKSTLSERSEEDGMDVRILPPNENLSRNTHSIGNQAFLSVCSLQIPAGWSWQYSGQGCAFVNFTLEFLTEQTPTVLVIDYVW